MSVVEASNVLHQQWVKGQSPSHLFIRYSRNRNLPVWMNILFCDLKLLCRGVGRSWSYLTLFLDPSLYTSLFVADPEDKSVREYVVTVWTHHPRKFALWGFTGIPANNLWSCIDTCQMGSKCIGASVNTGSRARRAWPNRSNHLGQSQTLVPLWDRELCQFPPSSGAVLAKSKCILEIYFMILFLSNNTS